MNERGREIEANIRRDIAAAGVPWAKFRLLSIALLRLNALGRPPTVQEQHAIMQRLADG